MSRARITDSDLNLTEFEDVPLNDHPTHTHPESSATGVDHQHRVPSPYTHDESAENSNGDSSTGPVWPGPMAPRSITETTRRWGWIRENFVLLAFSFLALAAVVGIVCGIVFGLRGKTGQIARRDLWWDKWV